MILCSCVIGWSLATGRLIPACPLTFLGRQRLRPPSISSSPAPMLRRRLALRGRRCHTNSRYITRDPATLGEAVMKKIMASALSVFIAVFPCVNAMAYGHANAYGGGSTYHSGNTTTRTNAYGGSATHTAGEGTSATNAYGGSAYHAEGSGTTTASNAYGGSATHYAGEGTTASNAYGGTAYHA